MKKIFFLILLSGICQVTAQDMERSYADSLAKAYMKKKPGSLVIGMVDDKQEKIFYYGETKDGNNKKPDSSSIYEAGALAETFTCLLYAQMSVKGVIRPDEKLKNLLPVEIPSPVYQHIICQPTEESQNRILNHENDGFAQFTPYTCFPDPSAKPQEILICDLATHTTGFPEYPFNLKQRKYQKDPDAVYNQDDLYYFLKNFRFDKPLGYDYRHSTLGIAILAHALTGKANKEFDSMLVEQLTGPMKLNDCRINLNQEQLHRKVQGYNQKGKEVFSRKYDLFSPATVLNLSVNNMMDFLQYNISVSGGEFSNLLDYTHNERIRLTGKKGDVQSIALGWKIQTMPHEKYMVWQGGISNGFACFIGFIETTHTGVFILSSRSEDISEAGTGLMKFLLNR